VIVGREREKQRLESLYHSKKSELVAVYGRRRVGKTYLVRETFSNKDCDFVYSVGQKKASHERQLEIFTEALSEAYYRNAPILPPKNWDAAFKLLHSEIMSSNRKVVIFLDELPWMAKPRSGLLSTIEYYWNRHWQQLEKVKLIVCGSSAAWIIKKIIHDKGGLHGRITAKIKVDPFTLYESESYLKYRNIKLNQKQITAIYMALGGIPYYLNYLERGLSAEQNIQKCFFDEHAPLNGEFKLLFESLFTKAPAYIEIVRLIAKKNEGMSRSDIQKQVKLTSLGGYLSERLQDLCMAGFLEEYIPFNKTHGEYYKVIDEFCLFNLSWLKERKRYLDDYWLSQAHTAGFVAWSGFAFEALCRKHIQQIANALKIKTSGVVSAWRSSKQVKSGAQIDLLIERFDDTITVCEIKFTEKPFKIDKAYADVLKNKLKVFQEQTKTTKQLFLAMIAAGGLKETMYSEELVSSVVTLSDLFKSLTD
jgi:uncharacterized protein